MNNIPYLRAYTLARIYCYFRAKLTQVCIDWFTHEGIIYIHTEVNLARICNRLDGKWRVFVRTHARTHIVLRPL